MRFGTKRNLAKTARIEEQEVLLPLELASGRKSCDLLTEFRRTKLAQINICRGFNKNFRYFTFRGKFVILYLGLF